MAAVQTAVARRYAEALFAAARQFEQIDAVEADLKALDGLLVKVPGFLEMMSNPLIQAERKEAILDQVLRDNVQETTLRFLYLLIRKRRSDVLPSIHDLYVEMANEFRGILPAYVECAAPLLPSEEETLAARLAALTGKQVVLHCEVDPELIGGLRVRIGDTILDGSVVGYLRQLREKLKETLV